MQKSGPRCTNSAGTHSNISLPSFQPAKFHLSRASLCISLGFIHLRLKSINGLFLPPDPSCRFRSCFNSPTRFIPLLLLMFPARESVTGEFDLLPSFRKRNGQKEAKKSFILSKKIPFFHKFPTFLHHRDLGRGCSRPPCSDFPNFFPQYLLLRIVSGAGRAAKICYWVEIWGKISHFKGKTLRQ